MAIVKSQSERSKQTPVLNAQLLNNASRVLLS